EDVARALRGLGQRQKVFGVPNTLQCLASGNHLRWNQAGLERAEDRSNGVVPEAFDLAEVVSQSLAQELVHRFPQLRSAAEPAFDDINRLACPQPNIRARQDLNRYLDDSIP